VTAEQEALFGGQVVAAGIMRKPEPIGVSLQTEGGSPWIAVSEWSMLAGVNF
jgi:hypothetical protein